MDFVFFGDLRPVLVRVHVEIDGKPHGQVWDEFLGKLFKYLDRDGNGTLSKEEAERAPTAPQLMRYLNGMSFYDNELFLVGRGGGANGAKMADLDANKDGKVTPDELKAYYKKTGFRAVSLGMGSTSGDSQALTDALFKYLDANKDGKLSKEELAAAPERLRPLDTDDDEMISVAELVPNRFGNEEGFAVAIGGGDVGQQALPDNAPLFRVEGAAPNDKLARRLLSQYDKDHNGKLSAKEIGLGAAEFAALDKNKDGQLDLSELSAFAGRPADLEMIYRLGKVPKGKEPGGLLKVILQDLPRSQGNERVQPVSLFSPDDRPQPLAGSVTKAGGGLKLGLPDAHIEFKAGTSAAMNDAGIKEYYLQQFKEADVAKKGYLERKPLENGQYQFFLFFFALADRNGDNKLTEKELSDFLDLQQAGSVCVVSLTAHDLGRGLFELIDVAPRDGRLGLREMRTAWSRLAALDRDGDGAISRTEVPRQVQLSVRQSGLGYPYQFAPAAVGYRSEMPVSAPTRGPLWFRKMDRNADGDVSPREWLGTEEEFKKIDADGDGLISAEEAERYDALLKKQEKR